MEWPLKKRGIESRTDDAALSSPALSHHIYPAWGLPVFAIGDQPIARRGL